MVVSWSVASTKVRRASDFEADETPHFSTFYATATRRIVTRGTV